jgi:hypothetical protein
MLFLRVALALLLSGTVVAEQKPGYLMPIAKETQSLLGPVARDSGAVGFYYKKLEQGFVVETVVPRGPADKAGIRVGDLIISIDGQSAAPIRVDDLDKILKTKRPSDKLVCEYVREGQQAQAVIQVENRASVYPEEMKGPPAVGQKFFGAHAAVVTTIAKDDGDPQHLTVWFYFSNVDAPLFKLDETKFFVLDGQGQQLRGLSMDEVKYSIQLYLAQNLRAGNYVPPPPPPARPSYRIEGTESGNYTITDLGGTATVSGSSTGSYTVTPEPDYSQLGYSLGLALRQWRDRKHDKKVLEQAQKAIGDVEANYLKTQTPLIPGENRSGAMTFWSARPISSPVKVVLFLHDPDTNKDESVTFEFR